MCPKVWFKITRTKGFDEINETTQVLKPNGLWKGWNSIEDGEWTLGEVRREWAGRVTRDIHRTDFHQVYIIWCLHDCGLMEKMVQMIVDPK